MVKIGQETIYIKKNFRPIKSGYTVIRIIHITKECIINYPDNADFLGDIVNNGNYITFV